MFKNIQNICFEKFFTGPATMSINRKHLFWRHAKPMNWYENTMKQDKTRIQPRPPKIVFPSYKFFLIIHLVGPCVGYKEWQDSMKITGKMKKKCFINIKSDKTLIYIFSIWNDGNGRVAIIAYSEGGYIWEKYYQLGKILRNEWQLPSPFSHFRMWNNRWIMMGYFDYLQR